MNALRVVDVIAAAADTCTFDSELCGWSSNFTREAASVDADLDSDYSASAAGGAVAGGQFLRHSGGSAQDAALLIDQFL